VVIASAGVSSANMSWKITTEQWQETIDVNLTGAFHTAKAAMPLLIAQATGGVIIIITSSVAGLKGLPFCGHYVASKHGMVGLARTMANELGQYSIRVNTVHPNGVANGMSPTDMLPFMTEHAQTLTPMYMNPLPEVISQPEDIANAIAWLASDEARHVTDIQLPVDLGNLVR